MSARDEPVAMQTRWLPWHAGPFLALALLLNIPVLAPAQNWQAGGHLIVGFPQGAFNSRVGHAGFGISGLIGCQPVQQPLLIGIQVGLLNYGSQTWPASTDRGTVEVRSNNNILLVHALVRLQADQGFLRPYLEGLVGLNWLFTSSMFETSPDYYGESETSLEIEFDDTAFSFGGGGGLQILLSGGEGEGEETEDGGKSEWLIELGVRYLAGSRSQYLKEGAIHTWSGEATFTPLESKTDLLMIQAGIAYRF